MDDSQAMTSDHLSRVVAETLQRGCVLRDKTGRPIQYRYLAPTDDLEELTTLLHDAYAPLAAAGMAFVASYQDVETTRRRIDQGETLVAVDGVRVVGTVTLKDAEHTHGSPFYDRADVASFGQFAVRPEYQGRGIGGVLLRLVEQRAAEKHVVGLGLDTSEHATHLIAMYRARGYEFIEHSQWQVTNYRSVIMGKALRVGAERE